MNLFENRIGGIEPFTLIDFPDKIAGILFYTNCNLHCPYCYNVELVKNICTKLNSNDVLNFIKKRKNKLDGFVFSGGECTIHGNNLINDIIFVKNAGFDIKVDTNGTNPDVIQKLLNLNPLLYSLYSVGVRFLSIDNGDADSAIITIKFLSLNIYPIFFSKFSNIFPS